MNLKLELFRYESLVFGKVLEQSEDLRIYTETLAEKKGFAIVSMDTPDLSNEALYIRGGRTLFDNNYFYHEYPTEERAAEVCEIITELVDEINEDSPIDTGPVERVL